MRRRNGRIDRNKRPLEVLLVIPGHGVKTESLCLKILPKPFMHNWTLGSNLRIDYEESRSWWSLPCCYTHTSHTPSEAGGLSPAVRLLASLAPLSSHPHQSHTIPSSPLSRWWAITSQEKNWVKWSLSMPIFINVICCGMSFCMLWMFFYYR